MTQNLNLLPCFEFVLGTNERIKSEMVLSISGETFFAHIEDLPHAMSLRTILGTHLKKDGTNTKALSPQQAADLCQTDTFHTENENWCWVKFASADPTLLSFVRIQKGPRVIWVVGEVSKRKSDYSPFGCRLVFKGSEKQQVTKEIKLPPEQVRKPVRDKRR